MTMSSAGRLTRSPSASLPLLIEMQSSLTSISTLLTRTRREESMSMPSELGMLWSAVMFTPSMVTSSEYRSEDAVVVDIDIDVVDAHAARRIDVDAVRTRDVVVGRDVHAVDGHVLRVQDVQAPHGLLAQLQVGDAHALAVLEADHPRAAGPGPRRRGAGFRRG